jgi:hypothetical protein
MNVAMQIEDAQQAVASDLVDELGGTEEGEQLELTGVEVLIFLGLKVAIPVVTGFVSRELWERYNRVRTRKQAEEAQTALANAPSPRELQVDESEIVRAAAQNLVDEGIPTDIADRVARKAFERVVRQVAEQPR